MQSATMSVPVGAVFDQIMAERRPQTLPSRAWSGASMMEGIRNLTSKIVVKSELPENEQELRMMIQAWLLWLIM